MMKKEIKPGIERKHVSRVVSFPIANVFLLRQVLPGTLGLMMNRGTH